MLCHDKLKRLFSKFLLCKDTESLDGSFKNLSVRALKLRIRRMSQHKFLKATFKRKDNIPEYLIENN